MRLLASARSARGRIGAVGINVPLLLGLVTSAPSRSPTSHWKRVGGLIPCLVGGLIGGAACSTAMTGVHIGVASTPAYIEGRLGGFGDADPRHVVDVVEDDWFAESGYAGLHDPAYPDATGSILSTYSPVARTYVVVVFAAGTQFLAAELVCAGQRFDVPVFDEMRAILQNAPWPCSALVVATQNEGFDPTVTLISLDGSPISMLPADIPA